MTKEQFMYNVPGYIENVLEDFDDDETIDIKDALNTVAELMEANDD